jgi:hypothetical protein
LDIIDEEEKDDDEAIEHNNEDVTFKNISKFCSKRMKSIAEFMNSP